MQSSGAPSHLPDALLRLVHLAAVACLIALPLLSLLPADQIERTGAGKNVEHFIAYFGTGLLLTLGIADPRRRLYAALALVALAGTLEVAQSFTLTRSSELAQFLGGAAGAAAGLLAGTLGRALLLRIVGRL
jgi:VanZ family protein